MCRRRFRGVASLTPSLVNADDDKSGNGAQDEQAKKGHDSVERAPPAGALVTHLVILGNAALESGWHAELAFRTLLHGTLGIQRQGEERCNHPS